MTVHTFPPRGPLKNIGVLGDRIEEVLAEANGSEAINALCACLARALVLLKIDEDDAPLLVLKTLRTYRQMLDPGKAVNV